jgi:hypothetical protein
MSDISITTFVGFATITKVALMTPNQSRGFEKSTGEQDSVLKIEGKSFLNVSTVSINGLPSPNFFVGTEGLVFADIPESLVGEALTTVSVLKEDGESSTVSFALNNNTELQDANYALQRFMRVLLMTPGSDLFNPSRGGGLLQLAGSVNFEDAEISAVSSIKKAENEILLMQEGLSATKTIMQAIPLEVTFSVNSLTLAITLKLVMVSGSSVDTTFYI